MNTRLALTLLDLSSGYTLDQLKTAFKKSAIKWHPDHNKSVDASEQFKLRYDAYNLLLTELNKRRKRKENRKPTQTHYKNQFHRPLLDENSDTYKKIKRISEIVLGHAKVAEVEKTVKHTQDSLSEIFDLLGIDK